MLLYGVELIIVDEGRGMCYVKIVTKIKKKEEFGSPHSYTLFYKDFNDSEQRLGVTKAENSSRLRKCSRDLFREAYLYGF